MKVSLHIGPIKTGSTTIQKCLRKNISLEAHFCDRDLIVIHLLQLLEYYPIAKRYIYRLIVLRLLKIQEKAKLNGAKHLIFSDEAYMMNIRKINSSTRSINVAIAFKLAFGSVNIYAVERNWDNWITSVWKEKCLSMPFVPSLETFQNYQRNFQNLYSTCLSNFKKYGHNTNSVKFENDGTHVSQVVNAIFDDTLIIQAEKENRSTNSLRSHDIARYLNSILFLFWYPLELIETYISLCIELIHLRFLKFVFIVFRLFLRFINPRKQIRKLIRINPA